MSLYKSCRQCSKNKHLHQPLSWGAKPLSMCVTSGPLLWKLWCKETHVDMTQVFILPLFPCRNQEKWTGTLFWWVWQGQEVTDIITAHIISQHRFLLCRMRAWACNLTVEIAAETERNLRCFPREWSRCWGLWEIFHRETEPCRFTLINLNKSTPSRKCVIRMLLNTPIHAVKPEFKIFLIRKSS